MAEESFSVQVSGDPPNLNYYDRTWTSPYTTTWSYGTTTVYMYQLICPRCFEPNWGEIDAVVTCSGKIGRKTCGAKLKAIKEKVDFEVPVG
jgi:hypothetical protein